VRYEKGEKMKTPTTNLSRGVVFSFSRFGAKFAVADVVRESGHDAVVHYRNLRDFLRRSADSADSFTERRFPEVWYRGDCVDVDL
jgi:hypothetical protein